MASSQRVLAAQPVSNIDDYQGAGGGGGLKAAVRLGSEAVIEEVLASGLRGRGGAGFSTGRTWAAVAQNLAPVEPATVVVNAAEGEPGSFKDRAIVRADSYRVLEGDEKQLQKQPDWTFTDADSGKWPATRPEQRSTAAFE